MSWSLPSTEDRSPTATSPASGSSLGGGDRLLRNAALVSIALAALTFVASRFNAPLPGPIGARSLPRVPRPPASAGDILRMLGVGSLVWYVSFLSAPLFVWVARRAPFGRRRAAASVAVNLGIIVALTVLTSWAQYEVTYRGASYVPELGGYLRVGLITGMLPFFVVAAIAHAATAISRAHDREVEAERMRTQLAESRLAALTAQLQPHFLFNTLQGISTLIARDPAAADAMLTNLSDLLREVLRRGEQREIEFHEELAVLRPYLDISRQRFGDRLSVGVTFDDAARRALVPFFILQPLVENALRHGIEARAGAGSIAVDARRDDGRLLLTVTDNGAGEASGENGSGVGLANTRARLRELYGDAQSLDASRAESGGFRVRIAIPYRERPGDPSA
jgi:two-component system, LytTR family, sensor kinase